MAETDVPKPVLEHKLTTQAVELAYRRSRQVFIPLSSWEELSQAEQTTNAKFGAYVDEMSAKEIREAFKSMDEELARLEEQKQLVIATKKSLKRSVLGEPEKGTR